MPNIAAEQRVHVVAGLIRHPENPQQFLIAQRKKGQHLENLWEFPGGKLETGESRFAALRRELQEELDITVLQARPFQSLDHNYADKAIHLDIWEVTRFSGQARGHEQQAIRWVSADQLDDFEFPAADAPILSAIGLPEQLLITPDVVEGHEDEYLQQFSTLLQRQPYSLIQFRSHHLKDVTYAGLARDLRSVAKQYGSEIIINRGSFQSLDSPLFDEFTHRHLNSRLLNAAIDSSSAHEQVLSASCHDVQELKLAKRLGCRFAIASTVRATQSHPGRSPKGWFGINRLIRQVGLPVYVLGGVKRTDLEAARYQGAIGVAGISDFWSVPALPQIKSVKIKSNSDTA